MSDAISPTLKWEAERYWFNWLTGRNDIQFLTCFYCSGSGQVSSFLNQIKVCPKCSGAGVIRQIDRQAT